MTEKKDIPDCAICPKCEEPMKVIDLYAKAAEIGFRVDPGSYVIKCCGYELTIENELASDQLRDLLLAYHREHQLGLS